MNILFGSQKYAEFVKLLFINKNIKDEEWYWMITLTGWGS